MVAYHRPATLEEALAVRAGGDVMVLAGGTDVYPEKAARAGWGDMRHPDILDISAVPGLRGITEAAAGWRIGALTTWTDVIRAELPSLFDGLALAAREVGGAQIQNRGTLAGNICTASPAGDGAPNLLALDAGIELTSLRGRRHVQMRDFIDGYRHTQCRPDEIVTAILVPRPQRSARGHFLKLGARRYLVISIVMVAGVVETDAAGAISSARLAVGSCSAVPQRLPALEAALAGQPLAAAADVATAAHLVELAPIDDIRGSAAYRREAALTLVRSLLAELASPERRGDARILNVPSLAPRHSRKRAPRPRESRPELHLLAPAAGHPFCASLGGNDTRHGATQDAALAAAETTVSFTLNGEAMTVAAGPFASLADTLRERLGLTGTKIGCEAGDCGACTVILEGEQVCACLVATTQADGASIYTVEGAGPLGLTERLRSAFLAHGAAQCGICTPGMLMAAADLLARSPTPERPEVEDAIGGVLCRCTGYLKIVEAVLDVASAVGWSAMGSDPKHTAEPHVHLCTKGSDPVGADLVPAVGVRIARVDGWPKVAGTDKFGADEAPADALWMRVVRSPHASARFKLGDLDAVRAHNPGLVAILTAADVPGENAFGIFPKMKDQPVLGPGVVRFRGEAVLALVGSRSAVEGLSDADIPIAWEPLEPASGIDAALCGSTPAIHAGVPDNVLARGNLRCGSVVAGHAGAAATVEGSFETAFVEHAYIEPEAGFALPVGPGPDRIEVTACTQAPYMDLEETARVLGIEQSRVRICPTACGGGFGGKLDVSVQPLLAVAAWVTRRPVRIVFSRTESMVSTTKRHPARIWAKSSADARGHLTAFEMQADFNTGAYASWGPTVANRVPVHGMGPYKVSNARLNTRAIYTNDTPAGAFRGFGVPQAAIAHETLMDDLAERLRQDRWDIRRLNALDHGDTTPSGQVLHRSAGLPKCLDALKGDWGAALARVALHNARSPRRRRGVGIACMWYGCGNTALPNPSAMRIALSRDGALTFFNGAVDIGQGSSTVLLQIAADALGLPTTAFRMVVGDTDLTADAGKTSASRQTFVSGNAARLAGEDLRRKVLALANAGPDARLKLDGSQLSITDGEASRTIELAALPAKSFLRARSASAGIQPTAPSAHAAGFPPSASLGGTAARGNDNIVLEGLGYWDPPTTTLDENGQGIPYATYGFAAQMAEVEVDTALGTTKVVEIVAAHDVGRAINPTLVEGQIHGGIAQGLGLALMEEFIPGRTENLHDYLIPTVGDMPSVKTYLIEDEEPTGPFGAKGVGEPALIATAPAILAAIRHATGVRVTRVPVLPHRLWEALQARDGVRPYSSIRPTGEVGTVGSDPMDSEAVP
jgi:CO/xanthine dehydrogenase Mo-binding subunit/xanthine dehydrogenase iron-sulfur cluster and FAD-binding subunit A